MKNNSRTKVVTLRSKLQKYVCLFPTRTHETAEAAKLRYKRKFYGTSDHRLDLETFRSPPTTQRHVQCCLHLSLPRSKTFISEKHYPFRLVLILRWRLKRCMSHIKYVKYLISFTTARSRPTHHCKVSATPI